MRLTDKERLRILNAWLDAIDSLDVDRLLGEVETVCAARVKLARQWAGAEL